MANSVDIFNNSEPSALKEHSIEAIKYCLKNYHKLNSSLYPQSNAVKQQHLIEDNPVDA